MVAAACFSASPPPPFNADVQLVGGSTFNVVGASGDIYSQGGAVISESASGGTPGYSFSDGLTLDAGSGAVFVMPSGDGIHNTVGYSGLAVGNSLAFHFDWSAHDSGTPQQSDSGRNPTSPGSTYIIHRMS